MRELMLPLCLLFADPDMSHGDLDSEMAWLELLRILLRPHILTYVVIRTEEQS